MILITAAFQALVRLKHSKCYLTHTDGTCHVYSCGYHNVLLTAVNALTAHEET